MVAKHVVGLSSTEIAALWNTYMSESMSICFLKYLIKDNEDKDVEPLIQKSLQLSEKHLLEIINIFKKEKFPIPKGFSDEDVNLSAPSLFFDQFPLSFIYAMSRIGLSVYSTALSNVAREDVRSFFTECLHSTIELYDEGINLLLTKGLYDRPTMIPYPDHVEYLKDKETFLSKWLEPNRPLNVLELSEMFFNVERNYFAVILLTAFIQITNDNDIQTFFKKGKKLAQKQIEFINEKLISDDLLGVIMVNSEVSTSTVSPFSERLMLTFINTLNSLAVSFIGKALSATQRVDLVGEYYKLIDEIIAYGKDGMDLLIEREWLEQPPHAPNRKELAKK